MWGDGIPHLYFRPRPARRAPGRAVSWPVMNTVAPTKNRDRNKAVSAPSKKSASRRADTPAKKGQPLSAASPRERSPKQENL